MLDSRVVTVTIGKSLSGIRLCKWSFFRRLRSKDKKLSKSLLLWVKDKKLLKILLLWVKYGSNVTMFLSFEIETVFTLYVFVWVLVFRILIGWHARVIKKWRVQHATNPRFLQSSDYAIYLIRTQTVANF